MKPLKILEEREVFRMGDRYSVVEVDLETPGGDKTTWSYFKVKHGAVIVPIDEDRNTYIKKEWRLSRKDFTWEFASGWVDEAKDELPTTEEIITAANRELQEEIGLKAEKLNKVKSFYVANHANNQFHIVIAKDLSESKLEGDEHEYLDVRRVSVDEARRILLEDQVPTAQTEIAFHELEKELNL